MSRKQEPSPAQVSDESTSIEDVTKEGQTANSAAAADPDFEGKIELKYEDCPEKTGFAYPSYVLHLLHTTVQRPLTIPPPDGRNGPSSQSYSLYNAP